MRPADNERDTALRRDLDRFFPPADDLAFDVDQWWDRHRPRMGPRSRAWVVAAAAAASVLVATAAVIHQRPGPAPGTSFAARRTAEQSALGWLRRQDPRARILVKQAALVRRANFQALLGSASPFAPPYWDIQVEGPVVVSGRSWKLVAVLVDPRTDTVRTAYPEAHLYPVRHLPVDIWPFVPEGVKNVALTTSGPAVLWERPKSESKALAVIANLLRGAAVVHPHLPASPSRKVVIMDPIGPPVLYLELDTGRVLKIYPASTWDVQSGGQVSITYVPQVLALTMGTHAVFLRDAALVTWILNWQWNPYFTSQNTYWFP